MIDASLSEQLADQLRVSVGHLAELDEILSRECMMLQNHDAEGLARTIERKVAALEKLEDACRFLNGLFESSGLAKDHTEVWNIFGKRESQQLWQDFQRLLLSCRANNQVNGHLIRWNCASLEALLDVVRGKSGGQLHYAPTGRFKPAGDSYLVGTA